MLQSKHACLIPDKADRTVNMHLASFQELRPVVISKLSIEGLHAEIFSDIFKKRKPKAACLLDRLTSGTKQCMAFARAPEQRNDGPGPPDLLLHFSLSPTDRKGQAGVASTLTGASWAMVSWRCPQEGFCGCTNFPLCVVGP